MMKIPRISGVGTTIPLPLFPLSLQILLNQLLHKLSGLNASHNRHLEIHEHQFIGSVFAATWLFKSFFEHFESDFAIWSLLNVQHEVVLDHQLYCQDVEVGVVDY